MKDYFFMKKKYLVLVNKQNKLDDNYIPSDLIKLKKEYSSKDIYLKKVVKNSFEKMARDAIKLNLVLIAVSGYRSSKYQELLFNKYVTKTK